MRTNVARQLSHMHSESTTSTRPSQHDLPRLLTIDEAAELLRTTRRAIYAMVERRQLPGVVRIRPSRPAARGRPARLAGPEARAIAGRIERR